nr:GAF domain-containing protein [Clavibacter sp. VKM Ac-2873]
MDSIGRVDDSAVLAAATELRKATTHGSDLCGPIAVALGTDGAAVMTIGDLLGTAVVCATSPGFGALAGLQLDLGEGPCWRAASTAQVVAEPDIHARREGGREGPHHRAFRDAHVGAVLSVPMTVAGTSIGAVDLYSWNARPFSDVQLHAAETLASIAARQVLYRAMLPDDRADADELTWGDASSRRVVRLAVGAIADQTGATSQGSMLMLRSRATELGMTIRQAAAEIVSGALPVRSRDDTLWLSEEPGGDVSHHDRRPVEGVAVRPASEIRVATGPSAAGPMPRSGELEQT